MKWCSPFIGDLFQGEWPVPYRPVSSNITSISESSFAIGVKNRGVCTIGPLCSWFTGVCNV